MKELKMIWESHYWKNDLLRYSKSLRRQLIQQKWYEASFAHLEKSIMLGFYIVRKLIEAKKLSDSVANQKLPATNYPPKGKPISLMNWHKLDKLYDFSKGRTSSVKASFIANQFIHSYVFAPCFNKDGILDGVFVSSDRDRNHILRLVYIDDVIHLFESIVDDDPNEIRMVFNSERCDYDVESYTHERGKR